MGSHTQLDATLIRRSVGEVTKTDVSQAQARYAQAVAETLRSEGQLAAARSVFERVVGLPALDLIEPVMVKKMPQSLDQAIQDALKYSPLVKQAKNNYKASLANVKEAEGAFQPSLDVFGRVRDVSDGLFQNSDEMSVTTRLTMPLYQGGRLSAAVRRAEAQAKQNHAAVNQARRQVVDDTTQGILLAMRPVANINEYASKCNI